LVAAFRYLIYKHSTFVRHKVIRALPNVTANYWKGHNHTQNVLNDHNHTFKQF